MAEDYLREDAELANLRDELEEKGRIIDEKDEELQEKDRIINEITRELQERKEEIERVIKEKTREIQEKDEEKDRIIGEITRELQRGKNEEIVKVVNEKTRELQVKNEELQDKVDEKARELLGKDEELRSKTREIDTLLLKRETVKKFLLLTLCLAVVIVGGCVATLVEQNNSITQLQSSLAEREESIAQLQSSLAEREQNIAQLQRSLSATYYISHISGVGLSATATYPTHVIVELSDASGQPSSFEQNVTAELQSVDQSSVVTTTVSVKSPSQYEVSYTALSRGQHKVHVRLDGSEVRGSPFDITVYPDPIQLGKPVRVVTGLNCPWDIAINSHGKIMVSNFMGNKVSLLDSKGKEIQTPTQPRTVGTMEKWFGIVKSIPYGVLLDSIQTYMSDCYRPDQMMFPTGVAVDSDDNMYVASEHKLQKFRRDGHFIKCVGHEGSKNLEFRQPKGVRLHHGCVYVCDSGNNRIQVFDTDLNFIRTIGSPGSGRGQFNWPYDLDFDSEGKAYISDYKNHRIQVIDTSGQFVRQFGQEEGEGKLKEPTAVHVMGQFVYVSDEGHYRIAVYQTSGQFVISFGNHGEGEEEFTDPYGITSDQSSFVYVADFNNNRVQIF